MREAQRYEIVWIDKETSMSINHKVTALTASFIGHDSLTAVDGQSQTAGSHTVLRTDVADFAAVIQLVLTAELAAGYPLALVLARQSNSRRTIDQRLAI